MISRLKPQKEPCFIRTELIIDFHGNIKIAEWKTIPIRAAQNIVFVVFLNDIPIFV